jgi:6,7-dimethyl-8-ribityllumazine synthase
MAKSGKYDAVICLGAVFHWNDLPANATEIVTYKPSPNNVKDYILTVSTDTGESSIYTIRIKANYDTGKANLQQAVEARRQTNAKYS